MIQRIPPGGNVWYTILILTRRWRNQPMMCLDLGQGADAQWQYFSAEDLPRQDRDGAASLREKYGRDGSAT